MIGKSSRYMSTSKERLCLQNIFCGNQRRNTIPRETYESIRETYSRRKHLVEGSKKVELLVVL